MTDLSTGAYASDSPSDDGSSKAAQVATQTKEAAGQAATDVDDVTQLAQALDPGRLGLRDDRLGAAFVAGMAECLAALVMDAGG